MKQLPRDWKRFTRYPYSTVPEEDSDADTSWAASCCQTPGSSLTSALASQAGVSRQAQGLNMDGRSATVHHGMWTVVTSLRRRSCCQPASLAWLPGSQWETKQHHLGPVWRRQAHSLCLPHVSPHPITRTPAPGKPQEPLGQGHVNTRGEGRESRGLSNNQVKHLKCPTR